MSITYKKCNIIGIKPQDSSSIPSLLSSSLQIFLHLTYKSTKTSHTSHSNHLLQGYENCFDNLTDALYSWLLTAPQSQMSSHTLTVYQDNPPNTPSAVSDHNPPSPHRSPPRPALPPSILPPLALPWSASSRPSLRRHQHFQKHS